MESWRQHLRFAVRQLWRNPGFTATVILTLALSIGANTAIFSVVNALMLKSLPYSHPERMGTIYTRVTGSSASDERHDLNGEQWELLRDNVPSLISAVSSRGTSGVNLRAGSHVQYLHAGRISAHYLDVLAIHPIIGRNFSDAEDRAHGTEGRHPELQFVAQYLRLRSKYSGTGHSVERRAVHGHRCAPARMRLLP